MSATNRPKRALFNKPTWAAKPTTKVADDAAPIFGQNLVYEDIVAAEKKRREKHAERAKERAEKDKEKATREAFKVGDAKRRRVSIEQPHDESESESDTKTSRSVSNSSDHSRLRSRSLTPPKERPVLRSTSQKEKNEQLVDGLDSSRQLRTRPRPQKHSGSSKPATIVLDGNEEASSGQEKSNGRGTRRKRSDQKPASVAQEPDPESEEEDEYLRGLKTRAREEARTKKFQRDTSKEATPDTIGRPISRDIRSPSQARESSLNPQVSSRQASLAPDPNDPKVEIFIRTMIPGARELIVTRHASQPLDKVKEFWSQRNELHPAIASKVFFTWNGTRLFDSTTMRSIIVRLKKLHPMPDGSDPSLGRIEIEAMTEEILQHRQKQKERRKNEAAGISESDANNDAPDNASTSNSISGVNGIDEKPVQPPEKTGIVIKLTSPGIEDMMLRLRPNTTVAKIISGYRKIKKIDPGKQCWLVFDGERLEDTQTVEGVEFEHEDTVEVHIR